ncbi:osteocalcin isoform X2 [Corapipo altera]|uniref:osteocalcin isoform X2 n=1 Tax=Corapipo altera TaxID=415028 RepID=UPI000FD681E1|nr:osteocalcin isoform X2 [Corapipo altera]
MLDLSQVLLLGPAAALAMQPVGCDMGELHETKGTGTCLLALLLGHSTTLPEEEHVPVPKKWANKSSLALHREENPTGFVRKVYWCGSSLLGSNSGKGDRVVSGGLGVSQCPIACPRGHRVLPGRQGWAHQEIPLGLGVCFPPFVGSDQARGDQVHPKPQLPSVLAAPAAADVLEITLVGLWPPLAGAAAPYKSAQAAGDAASPAQGGTMKPLVLLTLLALLTLGVCRRAADRSTSADDSPSSEAFISRRASAQVVQRQKRNYGYGSVYAAPPDPLEAKREVCELSPDCDELADQVGLQEAYRRYYGFV